MSATAYSHYPLKNPGNTYIHSTRLKVQGNKFLQFQWIRYKLRDKIEIAHQNSFHTRQQTQKENKGEFDLNIG